jgi:hypothetical protein
MAAVSAGQQGSGFGQTTGKGMANAEPGQQRPDLPLNVCAGESLEVNRTGPIPAPQRPNYREMFAPAGGF